MLAVKIDNTTKAHPQQGVSKADVVYITQVEGGVTRLVALYSSVLPQKVGPIRSARITDIDLLQQYGTVALAYAGSNRRMVKPLRQADLKLLSGTSGRGFSRASNRPAPYNVIGDTATLMKRAGNVDVPKRVGYGFGPAPAGGKPARSVLATYPFATVGAVWSKRSKRWLLSMDGRKDMAAEGGQLGASTFVVQFATVRPTTFKDVNGVHTPKTETVGKGKALIFRDGMVYPARWSRPREVDPTTYTIGGQKAVFAPGTVWIALIGRGRPVSVR